MPVRRPSAIVEFRQYRLHPGAREILVSLFDRHFVESQEACGMTVIGQFRDLDDPDRFTWLRGFETMPARTEALSAFYGGPVWARHKAAANATMIAFDDVHLLRPLDDEHGFAVDPTRRLPVGSNAERAGFVLAVILPRGNGVVGEVARAVADSGGRMIATLVTEKGPNTWPRLPVHEDADVTALFAAFEDRARLDCGFAAASAGRGFNRRSLSVEVRRLAPSARSALP